MWQGWELKKKELRTEIDKIDFETIRMIAERMQLCEEIGRIKANQDSVVYEPEREIKVFESRQRWGEKYGFNSKFIHILFKVILSESKRIQKELVKI